MVDECALIGTDEIVNYLRWSRQKFFNYLPEMKESGVIITQWMGKPPKRRLTTFPSLLQKYLILKYKK